MQHALDELLSNLVDGDAISGLVAAVFSRDGTLYQGAFGSVHSDSTSDSYRAMEQDSVMAIMSMTKALTASAALQLVERGALQLDTPAADVCPELAASQVLGGFDEDGQPLMRTPSKPITLRHLLTHTSGFVYSTWNKNMVRYMAHTDTPDISTLKKAALNVPILFDPGTRWEYGIGIDWVGQLIETASGQTLGAFLQEHLTGPLGMQDTAFSASTDMARRQVPMQMRQKDGSLKPLKSRANDNPEFEMGGGGLLSTVADYGRFIRMILGHGKFENRRLLSTDSIALMSSNQIGDLRVGALPSALPALSNDAEFFPGEPKTWSLGFQVSETACHTGRPAGTLMWAGLSNCYYWIDPVNTIGGAFLTQVFPFVDQQILPAYYAFESAVYDQLT